MFERVCQHCGAIYYSTPVDETIFNCPLCVACLTHADGRCWLYYGFNPVSRYPAGPMASQEVADKTSPVVAR